MLEKKDNRLPCFVLVEVELVFNREPTQIQKTLGSVHDARNKGMKRWKVTRGEEWANALTFTSLYPEIKYPPPPFQK